MIATNQVQPMGLKAADAMTEVEVPAAVDEGAPLVRLLLTAHTGGSKSTRASATVNGHDGLEGSSKHKQVTLAIVGAGQRGQVSHQSWLILYHHAD